MRDGRTVMVSRMADIGKLSLISAMLGRDVETVRARSTGFSAAHATAGDLVLSAKGSGSGTGFGTLASRCVNARSSDSPAFWALAAPKSRAPYSALIPRMQERSR